MTILPDFLEFISRLKVPVIIVTDLTAHIQHRKIAMLNLDPFIHSLITSEEAGIEKPNQKIFELATKKLNLDYKDFFFIGDNFRKDIEGPSKLGIDSYWFTPNSSLESLTKKEFYFQFSNFNHLLHLTQG